MLTNPSTHYDLYVGIPISCLLKFESAARNFQPGEGLLGDCENGWIVCSSTAESGGLARGGHQNGTLGVAVHSPQDEVSQIHLSGSRRTPDCWIMESPLCSFVSVHWGKGYGLKINTKNEHKHTYLYNNTDYWLNRPANTITLVRSTIY